MKKRLALLLLVMMLLLCGCKEEKKVGLLFEPAVSEETATEAPTEAPVIETVPADGNPDDVTCKGSYTAQLEADSIVAMSGIAELTNEQLSVWYWAEVARYRGENHETAPDFDRPLDVQRCEIDDSCNSWQQYFLKKALQSWHTAYALVQHSDEVPLATEEAFQPNLKNTKTYMTGMPATDVLYGYHTYYRPNSMHQAYLDQIPQLLEELAAEHGYATVEELTLEAFGAPVSAVEAFAYSYNRAYMYFTHLSHYVEPSREELDAFCDEHASEYFSREEIVDFRQILLIPDEDVQAGWSVTVAEDGTVTCPEEAWAACEEQARQVLEYWQKKNRGTEATFGETAHNQSEDTGMGENGGLYRGIRKGQLMAELDTWCFDPARQAGDTTIVRSAYGVHILYFSNRREAGRIEAEEAYYRMKQEALIAQAEEMFPLYVTYSAITLGQAEPVISADAILYPDIAHERFPEVPLYLQQDYPTTRYGGYKITTNGCGITSFAMLASYMADDELTPPEMCARYGSYSHSNGTDGMIFNIESAVLGFYMKEKTYDHRVAKAGLDEGRIVISVQHPGYWTRAGHYIVCEVVNENGLIQVRDSNIYNYGKLHGHKTDEHKWGHITENGSGFWVFDYKITRINGCSRCGSPDAQTRGMLHTDYICEKCETALLRRSTYLN